MNSTAVFKASIDLSKQNPYAKNLIREGDSQYLIKFKESKKGPVVAAVAEQVQQGAKQKSFGGYQKWVESYKKRAQIETNGQLLQTQE